MRHDAHAVVREYAEAVFRRARAPMEPLNFEVDWDDQPSRHKTYPGTHRISLPAALPRLPTLRDLLTGDQPAAGDRGWTLDRLATLLRLSYGVLDRRMVVNWNQDIAKRVHFPHAVWGRGTASGGGMYPVEIYWVAGPSGPLLPGVYHYSTGHHGFERLLTGDVTPIVRAALGDDAAGDQFLLTSIRFWKNSFKYNSFCYHVVTQDLGALLGSWDLLGRALGAPLRRRLAFDAGPLDELLALDTDQESVFTVVPLEWAGTGPVHAGTVGTGPERALPAARVAHEPFERSRTRLDFPQVVAVHRAAMAPVVGAGPEALRACAPAEQAVPAPSGPAVALPAPELDQLARPLSEVLTNRRSSFGRFRRPPELTAAQLGTTLAFASAGRRYPADLKLADGGPAFTRLWVFANHVDGLDPGTYAYAEDRHALLPARPAPEPDMSAFLQQQYFLTNYTMSQVGAVLAISGRLDALVTTFGPRGYRILNAEVGTVAQHVYCAATAQGVGCGAVLGFDNVSMDEALGLDGTDERTVLFLLLGREPETAADLAHQLW